jgi:hypothetical protein
MRRGSCELKECRPSFALLRFIETPVTLGSLNISAVHRRVNFAAQPRMLLSVVSSIAWHVPGVSRIFAR